MRTQRKLAFEREVRRQAGQSVNNKMTELVDDVVAPYFFMSLAAIGLTSYTWINRYLEIEPNPWIVTAIALLVVMYSSYKILIALKQFRLLRQGRDGERYVGQTLEELRSAGYKVFHDIETDTFNVDHVVIGPSGIYVIETKTWSNASKIYSASYDGVTLKLNGHAVPNNPIMQAQASSKWLSNIFQQSTGTRFFVQPIIALPSKYIDPSVNKSLEAEHLFMINPKNINEFLSKRKEVFSAEEISKISLHLSEFIALRNNI